MSRILVTRLDNAGDVILAGPAVRAAAAHGAVTLLCGPHGEPAARLLPGVADVLVWDAPWVGFAPSAVDRTETMELIADLESRRFDAAAVLTSFHQSPLPLALLLRLAGVPEIAAVSVDYPGSLLDHRLPFRAEAHEVEQALEVTGALGFDPPADDRLELALGEVEPAEPGYVVVHPGASVPARTMPPALVIGVVERLAETTRVVVTGSDLERKMEPLPPLPPSVEDRRGGTSFAELARVIAAADAIVVGNTGPAHVAAATGTPVVSVFAPVVPAHRWRPWRVPHVLLGDQTIACAGCRARVCPFPIQHCVEKITVDDVLGAVRGLRRVAARAELPA